MNKQDILIIHGTDFKQMAKTILEYGEVAKDIGDTKKQIALKPNLVVAKPPSCGATTHAELLAGTIEYLQEHGFYNISVMEGSWIGDDTQSAFDTAGYREISRRYQIPLIDLQRDSSSEYDAAGIKLRLCDQAARVDYMINMPVLKGHCQTTVTCALKNYKGIIPNSEKRRYHTMGLHKPIAHLSTIVPKGFILVDNICGDLDFEEGGNPVVMNRVLGFRDPVLCDAYVCDCMGYTPDDVPYIRLAERLGSGCADTSQANLIMLNEDTTGSESFHMTRRVQSLAEYTDAREACSACYGSLIYALDRLNNAGMLHSKKSPVCIGQAYKNQTGTIGIGQCTCCFSKSLKGCPPKAIDIVEFLEKEWI